jgi:hypothetical protein
MKLFPFFFVPHFLACVTSCSYFQRDNKPVESTSSEALANKKAFYCSEGRRVLSERGFMDDRCDSLLFTSLFSTACGGVDLSAWEDPAGKWHRNPQRDCFINGAPNGSASSISRDMFLGLWHAKWSQKDGMDIREMRQYGEANNWVMGEAKDNETLLSRCLLTPQLITLLKEMDRQLGGQVGNPSQLRNTDNSGDALPVNTGFRAHLDVLRILLQGRVFGAITDAEKALLKDQAERQPNNALYVAAYEKYHGGTKAHSLLLSEAHFPNGRLPTSSEHCINYLHSRDDSDSDWQPCAEENKEHDGTDFVFAAWVALGSF